MWRKKREKGEELLLKLTIKNKEGTNLRQNLLQLEKLSKAPEIKKMKKGKNNKNQRLSWINRMQ